MRADWVVRSEVQCGEESPMTGGDFYEGGMGPWIDARTGFRSWGLPGLFPEEELVERADDIMKPLMDLPATAAIDPVFRSRTMPQLLTQLIMRHSVSLHELQSLILPGCWKLSVGAAFQNKEEFFRFTRCAPSPGQVGEVKGLKLPGKYMDTLDLCMTLKAPSIKSGRWVQLPSGHVVVRFSPGSMDGSSYGWAPSIDMLEAALSSLSRVRWTRELHWAFPCEYRRRAIFLCMVGRRLNLGKVWAKFILPFFMCLSTDEWKAAVWGFWQPGDFVEYFSRSSRSWQPGRVIATDTDTNTVMLDIRPNQWLTPQEQRALLRKQQPMAARAA